jgi:serine/threonine-protein kinase
MVDTLRRVALPARYLYLDLIGESGIASVFTAHDSVLDRTVAVKILSVRSAQDPSARRRFVQGARAWASVSRHPHVVTVFDVAESVDSQRLPFIVMEYMPRGTLADRLPTRSDEGADTPVPTALRWLAQAASALDAAHALGVVHGGLHPRDLLLHEKGRLAISDFGLATRTGRPRGNGVLTWRNASYLSPEQAQGRPAIPASDLYSLTVISYELLCGRRLFQVTTPALEAWAQAEVAAPIASGPCRGAAGVFAEALAKDPARRPRSVGGFVAALADALGEEGPYRAPIAADAVLWKPPQPRPSPLRPQIMGAPAPPQTSRRAPQRILAWVALLLAGAAVAFLIAQFAGGGEDHATSSSSRRTTATAPSRTAAGLSPARQRDRSSPDATIPGSSTGVGERRTGGTVQQAPAVSNPAEPDADGRSAAELNNTGFALLPMRPGEALPMLRRAVEGFRADGNRASIDYAYSLYNLGWALRLAGRPAEAIPYLQERLRISDYKRDVVEAELRTAERLAAAR